jgi:peptidoglycan lytic transglycosylase G
VSAPAKKPRRPQATPRPRRRRGAKLRALWRRWRSLFIVLFVGWIVGGFCIGTWSWFAGRPGPSSPPVSIAWPEGLDPGEAAVLLHDVGLTDGVTSVALYLRITRSADCFRPGPHLLPGGASPRALVAALCRTSARPMVKLTIPEGFHRFAIAERLESAGVTARTSFLHATADPALLHELSIDIGSVPSAATAEGWLFPATYDFAIDTEPADVVRRLVVESDRRWQRLLDKHRAGFDALAADLGFGRREVLTLAAMVEKEAVAADERPIIASVFLNRLRDPEFKHLQCDPTAMYGCLAMPELAACSNFDGKASPAINRDPHNPWSTYVTPGLPPGPIGSPGESSIAAVLAPADTRYRYFVAKGGGRHEFSETYDEHNAAVQRLRELR